MSQIISTREQESFIPGTGHSYVTASFRAPNGVEQTIPGEFDRHCVVEDFDDSELKNLVFGVLWQVTKKKIFDETRAEILKEFIVAQRKAGVKEPKEINQFALTLNAVRLRLLDAQEQKVGKLSAESIQKWAKTSGLEDALTEVQLTKLDPAHLDSEPHRAMVAAQVAGAIKLLTMLSGQALAEDKPRLDKALRVLGYCPVEGDTFAARLAARIKELSIPRNRKGAQDIDVDF